MDALSEMLVSQGVITEEKLAGVKSKAKGGSFIAEMYNAVDVDEAKVVDIFEKGFKFPKADLSGIMPEALGNFSKDHVLKYMCIPFEREGRRTKLAMLDPLDMSSIQAFSFVTGHSAVPHVTSKTELFQAIRKCFDMSQDLAVVLDKVSPEIEGEVELIQEPADKNIDELFQMGKRQELLDDSVLAPAIKLVNLVIKDAMQCRASDIHIEPGQNVVNVRMRIDGVLKSHLQVPKWIHAAVASRIKIMSKLDISNRKTPQDGAIKLKIGDSQLDLRVSTLPTHLGEKVVIRLLKPGESAIALTSTGIDREDLAKIRRAISKPQGMILVTGPTGSGKTTTLHSMLKEMLSEKTNIVTVEDPVEYELQGITQVHVHEKAGLTFANALRSILRQDPDVVMVGEIRDLETADVAFRASMTGHLVLSTLHTNGTAATITRLFDIGVEPYLISSALHCIMAQRLVRVICPHCAGEYTPDGHMLNGLPGINKNAKFRKGKGCDKCSMTGYNGRIALFEIMELSPELRKHISARAAVREIMETAKREGMRTLYAAALDKVYQGVTTIEEVLRVITVEEKAGTVCTNCGRTFTEEECPYCGETGEMVCAKCGGEVEEAWNYCPACGKAKERAALPAPSERLRAVVVDDEAGILKMVEIALKALNLEIHTAQNGKEALEKTLEVAPHLVITDINMPVMDGFELVRELRSKVSTMFIPVVILSSRDAAEDKLKGFTYGSDDYITKPFDYSELQARVRRLLERTYS
jgi:type IV pilus assembly protein PilB